MNEVVEAFIRKLKSHGYRVAIHYFSLSSPSLAVRRVKLRVALGGHDFPADVIRRRFTRSASNFFKLYAPLADEWSVYDNTAVGVAEFVAEFDGTTISIKAPKIWQKLQALATAH